MVFHKELKPMMKELLTILSFEPEETDEGKLYKELSANYSGWSKSLSNVIHFEKILEAVASFLG